jgi:pSer/pThr/pTyr-binding forkhead associated (FHA) protein
MPDGVLSALKVGLLVMLYLFFLRVLRVVWAQLRDPKVVAAGGAVSTAAPAPAVAHVAAAAEPSRPVYLAPTQFILVSPDGSATTLGPLDEETIIGRAAGCQVRIDDGFASQVHARLLHHEGTWFIEDAGSTNGTFLNDVRIAGVVPVAAGDRVKFGSTVLEIR